MAENREQIIRTEYSEIMQKSYIDYAMSVIIARALPDVRDGLNRCSAELCTICMNWASVMTAHIVSVRVLSVIPWVNIILMVTVPFTEPWS